MPLTAAGTSAAGRAATGGASSSSSGGAAGSGGSQEDQLRIEMLGAGNEVGRSCCVLTYKGKTVVCDAGVHPAYTGIAALPFIDELDWSTVDALLITHFHLDHAAALTYIMEKTNFKDGKGKVYMTHPTKAVYRFLMSDFVRISNAGSDDRLFDEMEMLASWRQIEAVDFHQDVSVGGGLRFTPYHAGHVLGACMFLIEIAGLRILYTGDFSREEDRHLIQAEIPPVRPDVLICESTYGVQSLEPRLDKEQRFTAMVQNIISRGGRVLLPVFVLGRAQELLLLLDEFWSAHPELQRVPIYYASSLARKCIGIYQTYIHTMNDHVRSRFNRRDNPFVFKHVSNLRSLDKFEDKGPCVMMASPGFMQSGVSRELLERWAPDRRNGLIVTGYSVEGTMARNILNEPDDIIAMNGQKIPRRMTVDYISFSAHVDYAQNSRFIDEIKAQHIVLVHGEATAMARLRAALQSKYSEKSEGVKIHTPRNCEPLKLHFRAERLAKAIGSIAEQPPKPGSAMSGLLVSKDFAYTILDPKDLAEFTGLNTSTIIQRQRVALNVSWEMARWHLEGMYGSVQEGVDLEDVRTMRIMGSLDVKKSGSHELLLEWVSSVNNDMIADSALALLLGIDSSPASVKMTTRPHNHGHNHEHGGEDSAKEAAEERHPFADFDAAGYAEGANVAAQKRIERASKIAAFLEAYYGQVEEVTIGQDLEADAHGEGQGEVEGAPTDDAMTEAPGTANDDAELPQAASALESTTGVAIKEEPTEDLLPASDTAATDDAAAVQDGDVKMEVEEQKAQSVEVAQTTTEVEAGPSSPAIPLGPKNPSLTNGHGPRRRRNRAGAGAGAAAAKASQPTVVATSLEKMIPGPPRQGLKIRLDDKVAVVDLSLDDASRSSDTSASQVDNLAGSQGGSEEGSIAIYSTSEPLRKRLLALVALADRSATSLTEAFATTANAATTATGTGHGEVLTSLLFMGKGAPPLSGDGLDEKGEEEEHQHQHQLHQGGMDKSRKKLKMESEACAEADGIEPS